ncbi:MAG: glycosyltransferase [Chloroflexi bacterium]|nr:glycosyltransferase [Chloroflexota bacterium]
MTANNPKISVIMSAYNAAKYLREAIDSILRQTFGDFEFVIVNDGSADNSLDVIRSYPDPRIVIIDNERNIGLTRSLNRALGAARGEFLARQDTDDISLPERFELQLDYLERHPEVGLLGASVYTIDEGGKLTGKKMAPANPGKAFRHVPFAHGTAMMRKEVIDKLGGYCEWLKYAQDYELWSRIAKRYEVRSLTQPLYKLRYHRGSIWSRKVEEATLYAMLGRKMARDEVVAPGLLETLQNNGMEALYASFSIKEKMDYHRIIARAYVRNGDVARARHAYKSLLRLHRFDIESMAGLILSYAGGGLAVKGYRLIGSLLRSR